MLILHMKGFHSLKGIDENQNAHVAYAIFASQHLSVREILKSRRGRLSASVTISRAKQMMHFNMCIGCLHQLVLLAETWEGMRTMSLMIHSKFRVGILPSNL